MTYFVIPSRRTRQPQGGARLSSLIIRPQCVILPPSTLDVANGAAGSLRGVAKLDVGPAGNAIDITGATGTGDRFDVSDASGNLPGSFTRLHVFSIKNLATYTALSDTNYLDGAAQLIRVETNGAIALIASYQALRAQTAAGVVVPGSVHCLVLSYDNSAGRYCFALDGKEIASGTGATYAWNQNRNFALGTSYVTASGDHKHYLFSSWNQELARPVVLQLSANPWQLFAPNPRRLYFGASGGGATTTTIEPGKGFLAVAGYAPGIAQPRTIAPSKGAATLTGYAPGIEQDKSVAPAKGALTLTGYVPTLTQPRTIAAVKGALTLSGYAPGISQSASGTIAPGAGALLLTGHAPGLEQDRNVAPAKGTLTLTGGQPGIVQNVTTFIAPSKGALTATGYAPSVSGTANQAIAPTQGALLLGGYAPVLTQTGAQIIGPIKGALTLAGYAPTVQVIGAGVTVVEPSQGALSLSGYAPLIGVILAADAPDSTRLIDRDSARIGTNVPSWRRPRLG